MIEIEAAKLTNVALFKDQVIPISTASRLTVVTGHNKDSVSSDQKNAAGKSLAFSTLPNVFYQSSPLSIKKNSKRDLLRNKTSQTSIILRSNGTRYKINQTPTKYKIYEFQDNKFVDQKVRTDKIQREYLSKIFGITQTEFYSYVYIQTQRPLDFQIGSPAQRLDFITEVFQLNVFDRLRQFFNNKLASIKDDEIKAKVIASKLQSVNEQLAGLTWTKESKQELDLNKKQRSNLDSKIQQTLDNVQAAQSLLTGLHAVLTIDKKLDKLRDDYPFDTGPDKTLVLLKQEVKVRQTLSTYRSRLTDYKQALASVDKRLSSLTKPKQKESSVHADLDKLNSRISSVSKTLTEQKSLLAAKSEILKSIKVYKKKLAAVKNEIPNDYKSGLSDSELDEEVASCSNNIKLERLLKHGDCTCPTCLQDLDVKTLKKIVTEAKSRYTTLQYMRKYRALCSELNDLKTSLDNTVSSLENTEGLVQELKVLKSKKEKLQADLRQISQYNSLIEQRTEILNKKPKKPDCSSTFPDLSDKQIEKYLEDCHEIVKLLSSKTSLYESHTQELLGYNLTQICKVPSKMEHYNKLLNKQLGEFTSLATKLKKKSDKLKDSIRTLELSRERYSVLETQRLELEKELTELRPVIDKRKTYEALVKAYSKKGLKINAAMACLNLLEQKLNEYSSLIFFEPFKFKIQQVAQGIVCNVDRANGNTTDVSLLSGSETNCFRLLFMTAMLSLVSPERRTNFVVLDEADSAMDEQARHMYINTFLPALQQIVPHVFVITPGDPHLYPAADIWTVVKEKGSSRIIRNS